MEKVYLYRSISKGGMDYFLSNSSWVGAFLDDSKDGCSVEYQGKRTDLDISKEFSIRFGKNKGFYGVAKLIESQITSATNFNLGVKSAPSKNNSNHALIYDLNIGQINVLQASFLATICEVYGLI